MLTELSVVEQRFLAVREVLDGAKVTDVATRYGVDRRTVHRWLVRYVNEGLGALADRSSRPDRCPHQIAPEIEARIARKALFRRQAGDHRGPPQCRDRLCGMGSADSRTRCSPGPFRRGVRQDD